MPRAFLSRRHDRAIFALAWPALGTLAADPLVSIVDTAFVGRLGALPLAALGVNVAVFSFAFVLFNFLAYGTTPVVARALGRGDRSAAGRTVAHAFVLAVGLGAVAVALLQVFAGPVLTLMGATGELRAPAEGYLRIRALAGPALLIITAANGAFRGFQDTRTPLVITLGVAVLNLILDPLFIFTFGLGLTGAAIATTLAQWAGALAFLWVVARRRGVWRVPLVLPTLADLTPFLRVGWALLIRTFALIAAMTAATAVATRVGVIDVAAHQIASQLWLFLALVVDALAIAAQALVAKTVGEGQPDEARAVSDRLLFLGLMTGVALGVGMALLQGPLVRALTNDAGVIAAVAGVYAFVVWMQPLNALVFVWDGIFMAVEDFSFLAVAMLISAAVAAALLAPALPLSLGLAGVWWALTGLTVARAVTLAWRYRPAAGVFRLAAERSN